MIKCIRPSVALYSFNCVTFANLATRHQAEIFIGSCWKKAICQIFAEPEKMQIFFAEPGSNMTAGGRGAALGSGCKQEAKSATSSALSITG